MFYFISILALACTSLLPAARINSRKVVHPNTPELFSALLTVNKVYIEGLIFVPPEAVLVRLPAMVDKPLDAKAVQSIIRNLMNLGCFTEVKIEYRISSENEKIVELFVKVKEKQRLSSINFTGNNLLSVETLEKKMGLSKIHWIDIHDIVGIEKKIDKLYTDKQYYKVSYSHELSARSDGSVDLIIKVNEGNPSRIRCINFVGNNKVSRHTLKRIIGSREYWLLGFLDRGGAFKKEIVEFDKYQTFDFIKFLKISIK